MISLLGHLATIDRSTFDLINGVWTNPLLDRTMPRFSLIGNLGAVWIALLGAMAALGKRMGRRIAFAGLAALVIGFVSSEDIKEITTRRKPFAVLEQARLLVGSPHSYAFPSGHATSTFAAASGTVLAAKRLLKRVPLWGWGVLALAHGRGGGRDPEARKWLGEVPPHVPQAADQEDRTGRKDIRGDSGSRIRFLRGERR